jgi:hypothetical protein
VLNVCCKAVLHAETQFLLYQEMIFAHSNIHFSSCARRSFIFVLQLSSPNTKMFKRILLAIVAVVVYAALISLFFDLRDENINEGDETDLINLRFCCSSQKYNRKFINETFPTFIKESTGRKLQHEVQPHYKAPKCTLHPMGDDEMWKVLPVRP